MSQVEFGYLLCLKLNLEDVADAAATPNTFSVCDMHYNGNIIVSFF
jgi:hypothetical protein